ncbi:MAG: hypothetical protein WBE13_08810 [Candidatus Acidiferrum sp.]
MSARKTLLHLAAKTTMVFGAIFLVTVLLAAMPGHHAPAAQTAMVQEASGSQSQAMPGMDMSDEKASEKDAVAAMTPGNHNSHNPHMYMTSLRPPQPGDVERANGIVTELRASIEKYKDYRVALDDGYRIFLPNIPQPEYHFTNYRNGFLESFTFDPARPTSLLYKKTATGYDLVGAMYTMPRTATEDQLDARIPLSIAMWHLHTNLCFPRLGQLRTADWTKFGLGGSIATEEACSAAGGRFHPVVLGWMTHVYPYEHGLDKIFAMHGM